MRQQSRCAAGARLKTQKPRVGRQTGARGKFGAAVSSSTRYVGAPTEIAVIIALTYAVPERAASVAEDHTRCEHRKINGKSRSDEREWLAG